MSAFSSKQAHHAQKHTAHAIKGTCCDGCISMCVIERGRRVRVEEYWCDHRHRIVDPHEMECGHGGRHGGA